MPLPAHSQPIALPQAPAAPHTSSPRRRPNRPLPASGERQLTVLRNGTITLNAISFLISTKLAGHTITATWDPHAVMFTDDNGEVWAEYPWPPKGTRYLSKYDPNDPTRNRPGRPRKPRTSPMS